MNPADMVADPAGGQLVPLRETQALLALDQARQAITAAREAHDTDALREWRDRAAAVQHYARQRGDAQHVANDAGEIKVRAERALGQIDAEVAPHGGKKSSSVPPELAPLAGYNKDTRAAWRKLGTLSDEAFEGHVSDARDDELAGISTTKVLRLASTGEHGGGWGAALGREVTGYSQPRRRHLRKVIERLGFSVVASVRDEAQADEFVAGTLTARPPAPLIIALQNILAVERSYVAGSATLGDVQAAYLSAAVIAVLRAEYVTSSVIDEHGVEQVEDEQLAA